ncbi:MAG: hypothetical protein EZS28_005127 [Streblomastix strix]|uniref:Uncharacterized protein n=1 Tax=Streblomastix strix TaxID=222440 RepID=A0A5J4WWM2_9EUKA|nr:MAG: hypothetical protein EZS28_005127 [Streblomastix strix]
MDTKTIRQSKTLTRKALTSKRMIIEPKDNKTIMDPTTKPYMNKTKEIINQEKLDHHIQTIPNKNQEIQTFNYPKANNFQSAHLQNQVKLQGKLQYPNKGYKQPTTMIFEEKQEQRKKADVAPITEDKSANHFKGYKISAGSMKQKQRFNSKNQIEIEPDSETDWPDQWD